MRAKAFNTTAYNNWEPGQRFVYPDGRTVGSATVGALLEDAKVMVDTMSRLKPGVPGYEDLHDNVEATGLAVNRFQSDFTEAQHSLSAEIRNGMADQRERIDFAYKLYDVLEPTKNPVDSLAKKENLGWEAKIGYHGVEQTAK